MLVECREVKLLEGLGCVLGQRQQTVAHPVHVPEDGLGENLTLVITGVELFRQIGEAELVELGPELALNEDHLPG